MICVTTFCIGIPMPKPPKDGFVQIGEILDAIDTPKEKHAGGRPSSYKQEYAKDAEKLCRLGATDNELADFFEVDRVTIYRWKHQFPEFCHALKTGKDALDARVEQSLYHRAVGYTFDSEKVFQFQGQIVRAPVKEHVPPDTTAGIFWLKNRRPKDWRDVRQHEIGGPGDFTNMQDDELMREIRARAKVLGVAVPKQLDS